jgi:hypothetical protein
MSAPHVPPSQPLPPPPAHPSRPSGWQALSGAVLRGYHAYGGWLVGISWWRFALLSILLLIATALMQDLPPFNWRVPEVVVHDAEIISEPPPIPGAPKVPVPPRPPAVGARSPATPTSGGTAGAVQITIDKSGVHIHPHRAADTASSPVSAASASEGIEINKDGIVIRVPPGADSEAVREAVREAHDAITEAAGEARQAAEEARQAAAEGKGGDKDAVTVNISAGRKRHVARLGDSLPDFALLWIAMSIILKISYKGRLQAEVKAAQATETAESESLKRQVVEARMAAMQAQVEPHFLFNTLASIDHLIETDPPRASKMQKNLIALLRASMPTMREANAHGVRDLGREMAVITPYLEILKVRMEDRLAATIDVPEGLRSAEFPPMMIQSLVENAIKHGLEPKPEGGTLTVKAEIVHGKLAVTVADTGLGFAKAATAGTGIGLNNIRERLLLLYGSKATLTVAENTPSGTKVTITVPYVAQTGDDARMAA